MSVTESDPNIRLSLLATAMNRGQQIIGQAIVAGRMPPADTTLAQPHGRMRAWRLSTIRAWRPEIAARCAAILETLEKFPKDAA